MHMQNMAATSPFMKVIDILCDQCEAAGTALFKFSQCEMGRVGGDTGIQQLPSAFIVELVYCGWITGKALG